MELGQARKNPLDAGEKDFRLFNERILVATHRGVFTQQNLEPRLSFYECYGRHLLVGMIILLVPFVEWKRLNKLKMNDSSLNMNAIHK